MTWKEFKDGAEAEGVKDEDVIDCIDVSSVSGEIKILVKSVEVEGEKRVDIWG